MDTPNLVTDFFLLHEYLKRGGGGGGGGLNSTENNKDWSLPYFPLLTYKVKDRSKWSLNF